MSPSDMPRIKYTEENILQKTYGTINQWNDITVML